MREAEPEDVRVVRAFSDSWETMDLDRIMAFLHPDVVWENVPTGEVKGAEAVRERLGAVLAQASAIRWIIVDLALSASGAVLTQRVDIVEKRKRRAELRLMGLFRLAEGRIVEWRDYFDLAGYQRQLGAGWD